MIRLSTVALSSSRPRSACSARRFPSKTKGFVTTPTVRISISLARLAMMGAAPPPVPPPRPAVRKTMSAPWSCCRILSVSSMAALRPFSGSAPTPRPLVSFSPIWSLHSTGEWRSAWTSVFTTMNSTPVMLDVTMRLTALDPPPPTPITLMLAIVSESSSSLMVMPSPPF